VTVPVARGSARRTVRVAAALIAGQAALCAVIGYLTLGGPHLHKGSSAPAAPDPLAGAPLVVPPPQIPPPSSDAAPKQPPDSTSRSSVAASAGRPSRSAAPEQQRILAAEPSPPSATSPAAASPPAIASVPPSAPSPSVGDQFASPNPTNTDIQRDVEVGDSCSPLGADGLTADGTAVRCLRGADGQLRWQPA
jgi:hypothetical protein